MKKYGIAIICEELDEYNGNMIYQDYIEELFDTKEQAQERIKEHMDNQLNELGEEDFCIINDTIEDTWNGTMVARYSIMEFKMGGNEYDTNK